MTKISYVWRIGLALESEPAEKLKAILEKRHIKMIDYFTQRIMEDEL